MPTENLEPTVMEFDRLRILVGDCRDTLKTLPDASVQCCVTSPPYWGLRDYGVAGQIGQEATPELFVQTMVNVFREVRRVLKPDGTCWINLGDSYAAKPCSDGSDFNDGRSNRGSRKSGGIPVNLKAKDLVGIPWMVAFALRADGWYLRQDIVWHKPNPMPESVSDRCTKAHEYVFLLSKSERYFYDAEAIKEKVTGTAHARRSYKTPDGWDTSKGEGGHGAFHKDGREDGQTGYSHKRPPGVSPKSVAPDGMTRANTSFSAAVVDLVDNRNKRSVWTVPTAPFKEAHFATYPPALITPCILAGSRPNDVVLDPFGGSGTTAMVALQLGRQGILCELNADYAAMAARRTDTTPGLPFLS